MPAGRLHIHQFMPTSRANGPGLRAVVWVQGCTLGCPGCFNPLTHTRAGGEWVAVEDLFERIALLQGVVEGVTISGGEPLQQRRPLERLLARLRAETGLSTLLFSGYTHEEICAMPGHERLFDTLDVLLAGRYDAARRVASGLLGSSNKTIHFLTQRYTMTDLDSIPEAEVILTPSGEMFLSGIDPLRWD